MASFVSNTVQVHIARYNRVKGEYEFLVLQRSQDNALYPLVWQAVTGTVENGETALQAAVRELEEETGIIAKEMWTLPYVTMFFNPQSDEVHASPVFGVLADEGVVVRLSGEHREYRWLDYEACLALTPLPSHREATKVFLENVLLKDDRTLFKVKL